MMNMHPIVDSFPLSPMQQGMLFHQLMAPHSGVDIQQLVVHLLEEVDGSRLEAAWQWLVRRHDILRARFVWEGIEQPAQEITRVASSTCRAPKTKFLSVSRGGSSLVFGFLPMEPVPIRDGVVTVFFP